MPILHVHSPHKAIEFWPGDVLEPDTVVNRLREQGAKATICRPSFAGIITPPRLKKLLPPETSITLNVDDSGELARVTYAVDLDVVAPTSYGFKKLDENNLLVVIREDEPEYLIGPDHATNFTVSAPAGRGFTVRDMVGSMIMYRTIEEANTMLESFPRQQRSL